MRLRVAFALLLLWSAFAQAGAAAEQAREAPLAP